MDAAGPRGADSRPDGKAHGQAGEGPRRPKGRPGRKPGRNPQGRIAAKRLISWVGRFRDRINGFFRSASSRQSEDGTTCDNTTKLRTVVPGLLTRRTSRNKMDCDRNDENASRAMHLLMQFAHNLWQVFNSGMLRRLARGCRKVTQSMWARKLCEALHNIDFSDYEPETVYLSREYELECLTG